MFGRYKEGKIKDPPDCASRALAKLARIARGDCWHGGARASVLASRLERMGSQLPVRDVVAQAYGSSKGEAADYLPCVCPECGQTHQGIEAAIACCNWFDDQPEEEFCGE